MVYTPINLETEVNIEKIIDKERTINRINVNVYDRLKLRRWGDKLRRIDRLKDDKIYLGDFLK